MSPQLLSAFATGDQRRFKWMDSITSAGTRYYYPGKYKNTSSASIPEYQVVFRVAEQFLIRAEARFHQGNWVGAIEDLNVIRTRAGLPSLALTLSPPEIEQAIVQERRTELFCEWGHRWFDLNRTGTSTQVLGVMKPTWNPYDTLYPVPLNEILTNPNLTQNSGY